MNAISFYIEFLEQLKTRFYLKIEDIKMFLIITPAKASSIEDLPILPLVLKFAHLFESVPDLITTQ